MKSLYTLLLAGCLCAQTPPASSPDAPAPVRKDAIIVTGTYEPIPLDEADRAISQVPVRSQSLLFQSVIDTLKLDPSLDLQQRSPGGTQSDLSIRGSTNGQTLILVNGMRMNDAQTPHHDLNLTTPLDEVQSVEILRGAGSSMYGSDALGGVVNIVTAPPERSEIRVRSALGSAGINDEAASLAGVLGPLSEQLTLSRDFSSGFRFDRDYRDLGFGSTTLYKWGASATAVDLGFADRAFGADQFYGNYPSWERTKTWNADIRQNLGDRTEADFGYRRNSDLFVLFRDDPSVYENNHVSESWQASLRRREPLGGSATLFYGAEGYGDAIDSSNLGHHERARGAAYASLDVRVLKRFSFSAGVRDEVYHGMPGEVSPSVAIGYWASSKLKFRGGVSRAFRLPSYTDLYYQDPGNLGNPNLRPESAWSYEGGADYQLSSSIRLQATVFNRRDRDVIDYARYSPTSPWQALNVDRLNFTGAEASARYRLHDSVLDVSYSALHGSAQPASDLQSKYAFNYPVHSATVGWTGMLPGGFSARTRFGVLQRVGQDSYAVWDLYAARSAGRLRPFLQLTNLTNADYQEVTGVVMPGRTAIGGVEIGWR
ncbi:MAG: TonB-dependent receptor [Bryobacteraceae bacterium]|nr:TonB-dependent receptor [Bryobacteraceae bacterium]